MSEFDIITGRPDHVPDLIELAKSVEHLFGRMIGAGFESVLEVNIERSAILCAVASSPRADLLGGAIFDVRSAPNYHLSWLAVHERFRGRGVGRGLLSSALDRVVPPALVDVITFGPDSDEGQPARCLYESFGFQAGAMVERGSEGGTRQKYELRIDA